MGEFVDPISVHDPAAGSVAPASWGDAVRDAILSSPHLLQEQIPGSDVASITFSSIVATPFRHLELIISARGSQAATNISTLLRFNGDTAGNYDNQQVAGAAAAASAGEGIGSTSADIGPIPANNAPASVAGSQRILILDYARTTWQKAWQGSNGVKLSTSSGGIVVRAHAGFWRSTAAITTILYFPSAGNIKAGSIFSLYGIP